ncbi:MAG: hypothetical protein ABFD61_02230 [Chloroherpetonaceae bacterium]
MNLTELIFKYIDGTITRNEDAILRKMIEVNPSFKQEYDTLLSIDFEIKKDAEEIDYPDDFFDNVEHQIQYKIYLDKQNAIAKKKKIVRQAFVPLLALLLIFSISNIGNPSNQISKLYSGNKTFQSSTNQTPKELAKIKSPTGNRLRTKLMHTSTISNRNQQIQNSEIAENPIRPLEDSRFIKSNSRNYKIDSEYINDETFAQNIQMNNQNVNNRIFISNNFQQNVNAPIQASQGNISNSNVFNSLPNITNSVQVELNSFLGSDVAFFGVNKSNSTITSFTQSIAFDMDTKSKIGIETGYIQVGIEKDKYLEIKLSSLDAFGSTINSGGSGLLIKTPGKENYEQRIIWAGLFYERNILEYNALAISSRVGAGLSDNGFIGNVKLFAKYKVSKSIDFTLGGESKLFSGGDDVSVNNSKFISTISIIYGVHFGF